MDSSDGGMEVVVSPPVLENLELLFERHSGWAQNVGDVKPELRMKWVVLGGELSVLQMKIWTDSSGLVSFGRHVIVKNKSLVEEVGTLQKTLTVEQVA